jgi:prepilin-type N-terminal cleavage/methylation domain-containing protein
MTHPLPSALRQRRGFSLIELAAAMAILGLLAALVLPSLTVSRGRSGKAAELPRLRAVATGAPHRVVLDLDDHGYQLEWFVSEARAWGEAEAPTPEVYEPEEGDEVVMTAPPTPERAFHPLPGTYGDWVTLLEDVEFDGVETPTGRVDRGRVEIVFRQDGTTDATEILLSDGDGGVAALELEPLAHQIRIRRERS